MPRAHLNQNKSEMDLDPGRVSIELPLGELPEKIYIIRRVDISRLSMEQAQNLRRIQEGLDGEKAVLKSGRRVVNGNDAIKFILESF